MNMDLPETAPALVGRLTPEQTAALAAYCLEQLSDDDRCAVVNYSLGELEKAELAAAWEDGP